MTEPGRYTDVDRGGTKTGIVTGALGGLAVYAAGYAAWPTIARAPDERLGYAAWLCAGPALFIYAVFFSCLRFGDTPEAANPLLAAESMRWKINQRVLSNSVEQLVIFVPLLLALATRVDAAHVKLLPLHVACWLAARVVFWIGYRISPARRAIGMSWTHVTALLTIVWLAVFSL